MKYTASGEPIISLAQGGLEVPVIVCPNCGKGSDFVLDAAVDSKFYHGQKSAIGYCRLCNQEVYFRLASNNLDSVLFSYPQVTVSVSSHLPPEVKRAFEEALKCANESPNAALCMCRRAIQDALNNLGAKKGDLPTQLADLVEKHKITPDLKEWADHARIGGRIAAHGTGGKDWGEPDLEWAGEDDVQAVINFCDAFFEYVYILPARNRERRAQFKPESS